MFGVNTLEVEGFRYMGGDALYSRAKNQPLMTPVKIRMIPFFSFANRGESDMITWFHEKV